MNQPTVVSRTVFDGAVNSTTRKVSALIDLTLPTANVAINSGNTLTNNPAVYLWLTGNDPSPASSGIVQMRLSNDGTTWSEWEPHDMVKQWTISDGDGEKTVYVQFKDAAGNVSAIAQDTIELDTTAPNTTATRSPAANAAGWNNSNVTVTLNATDTGGFGVKELAYSATGAQAIASTTLGSSLASVPITTEGETMITYSATDNAGNTGAPKTQTIRLDKTNPTVSNVTPLNGKTGVRRDATLAAAFEETMNRATLTTSTFKLYKVVRNADGTTTTQQVTNTTVSSTTDGLKATLNPFGTSSTLLAPTSRYKAVITTGARDVAGNQLAKSKVWYFTTGSS